MTLHNFSIPYFKIICNPRAILLAVALVGVPLQVQSAPTPSVVASVSGYYALTNGEGGGIIPESRWQHIAEIRNDQPSHAEANGRGGTGAQGPCLACSLPVYTEAVVEGFASADPGVVRIYGASKVTALNGLAIGTISLLNNNAAYAYIEASAGFTDYLTVDVPGQSVGTPVNVPFHYGVDFIGIDATNSFSPTTVNVSFNITGLSPQIFSNKDSLQYFRSTLLVNGTYRYSLRSDNFTVPALVGDVLTISTTFGMAGNAKIYGDSPGAKEIFAYANGRNTAGIWLGNLPLGMVVTSASGHDYSIDPTTLPISTSPSTLQFSATNFPATEEAGTAIVTVIRAGDLTAAATVHFATSDGVALAGADYTATSGTLNFATGEISKTFLVTISNDAIAEAAESFTVTLSDATGATLGTQSTATITIAANTAAGGGVPPVTSPGTLQFSTTDFPTPEEAGTVIVTVTRTGDATAAATVHFATSDGVAIASADYIATSGTLNFIAGETFKTFSVPIINDAITEAAESFTVTLNDATGATLGTQSTATVTIAANTAVGDKGTTAVNDVAGGGGCSLSGRSTRSAPDPILPVMMFVAGGYLLHRRRQLLKRVPILPLEILR